MIKVGGLILSCSLCRIFSLKFPFAGLVPIHLFVISYKVLEEEKHGGIRRQKVLYKRGY